MSENETNDRKFYDLHVHTFLSDGVLGPGEVVRRATTAGAAGLIFSDHVDSVTLAATLNKFLQAAADFRRHRAAEVKFGCELTHVPPADIAGLARRAREIGAEFVTVHGETPVEPVEPGTNRAAVSCAAVDLLAHPGEISETDAKLAAENEVALEISARRGHSLTNGYLVDLVRKLDEQPPLVICTDAHAPGDFISSVRAAEILSGAGCPNPESILLNNQKIFQEAG